VDFGVFLLKIAPLNGISLPILAEGHTNSVVSEAFFCKSLSALRTIANRQKGKLPPEQFWQRFRKPPILADYRLSTGYIGSTPMPSAAKPPLLAYRHTYPVILVPLPQRKLFWVSVTVFLAAA